MKTPQHFCHRARHSRQRGSILVMTAGMLLVTVILLAGTQLGYAFYAKRDLQKTADLAALAGAKVVGAQGCALATVAALANAAINKQDAFNATAVPTCHMWDGKLPEGSDGRPENIKQRFAPEPNTPNAVKVVVTGTTPSFIPTLPPITQSAEAVATVDSPLAVFSVGSRLARVSGDSVLGATLKGLGLDLNGTSLVGYDGLAQVKVTPGGLLQALGIPVSTDIGIGEFNALLAARQVTLGDLLDAAATASGQTGLLKANAAVVTAIKAKLGVQSLPMVRLGTDPASVPNQRGLFAEIIAPDSTAGQALGVEINALDLIATSIGVATSNHAVLVPNFSLLGNTVTAKVGIIEPPSIGIGGVGATAYTAQVRAFIHLNTSNLPLLGGLVSNFAKLDLPLILDVSSARGTIAQMCTPELRNGAGKDRAKINVDAEILKVCVGGVDENTLFSTSASCEMGLQNKQLLKVGLLGVNVVDLTTKLQVDPLPSDRQVTLAEGEKGTVGNDLLLGTTVKDLTDALLAALLGNSLDVGNDLGRGVVVDPGAAGRTQIATDLFGTPACGNRACRINRLTAAEAEIETASTGLSGFVGSLTQGTLSILGDLLTLNVSNLLINVGGLVTGLLNTVNGVLGGLLDLLGLGSLLVNECTGGLKLVDGNATDAQCIAKIASSVSGTAGSGANQAPNALVAIVSFLLEILQPLLNGLGTSVLTPLLQNVLGLHLGETDVHMLSLKCGGTARLVY